MGIIRDSARIRSEICDQAEAWARGAVDKEWRLIRIKELVAELDGLAEIRKRYTVSAHAIERFMQASKKCKKEERAHDAILSLLGNAVPMELKERYRVPQLINHDFQEAEYYKFGPWLIVVCGSNVVTVYKETANRWRERQMVATAAD